MTVIRKLLNSKMLQSSEVLAVCLVEFELLFRRGGFNSFELVISNVICIV
jgi:hypothetical protein